MASGWTPLVNLETNAPRALGPMLLLSDGTVMAAYYGGTNWYKLTPDVHGSYTNGTWSNMALMNAGRFYYASAVLTNGNVFVAGAELDVGTSSAEVYDSIHDNWNFATIPPGLITGNNVPNGNGDNTAGFSDCESVILPDGTVMVAPVFPVIPNATVIYNPTLNSCSVGPSSLGSQNEASWVKLPDDSILTVDKSSTASERYIPSLSRWIPDANLPVPIYSATGSETGPALLLANGKAFFLGGNGNTLFYTPSGSTNPGAWTQGPAITNGLCARDTPAAMMSNGKILCALSALTNSIGNERPVFFYEFDPVANIFTAVGSPQNPAPGSPDNNSTSDFCSMLDLPDGTVLVSDGGFSGSGSQLYVYTPSGPPLPAGKPAISSITANGVSFHLVGTRLNGISQGAAYGDDRQMDSNYPLVRLGDGNGNFYYGRTYNWNSTGVMTGNTPVSTDFTLPPAVLFNGGAAYSLVVVANGISSDPVTFYGPVWVDFNPSILPQNGQYSFPYRTLAQGISAVPSGGTILIRTPGTSTEPQTITKAMTITAYSGPATIN
jgi:hypothetical protein